MRISDVSARHRDRRKPSLMKVSAIAVALGLVCAAALRILGGSEGQDSAADEIGVQVAAEDGDASDGAIDACENPTEIRVVAPAMLVDLMQSSAESACVDLAIVKADGRAGVRASEEPGVDLWISDSSMWAHARRVPLAGAVTSIASSPVVAVASPEMAAGLSKDGVFSWQSIAGLPDGANLAFQDPTGTATGLLSAWPVLKTLRAYDPVHFHGLALSAKALAGTTELAESDVAAPPANTVGLVAEYAVATGDAVTVMRGKEGEPFFDFPAYNQAEDAEKRAGVQRIIDVLASPASAEARADAQLRDPAGEATFDTAGLGTPGPRIPLPGPRDAISIFGLSASGSAVGRNLVAIDVSGSMAAIQPDGKMLFDTVRETSLVALSTLLDHTSVGLWAFGSEIDGPKDYRELEAVAPLGKNRDQLIGALRAARPIPTSGTGLYDTVLAGYRTLQRDFDPAAVTTLIVMTDGKNDEATGLNLPQLKKQLRRIKDPAKPIDFAGIGFGGADIAALDQISQITGGRVARVKDPVQLLGILISLIGETAAAA